MSLFASLGRDLDLRDVPQSKELVPAGSGAIINAHELTRIGPISEAKRQKFEHSTQPYLGQFTPPPQPSTQAAATQRFPPTPESGLRKPVEKPIQSIELVSDEEEEHGLYRTVRDIFDGASSGKRQVSVTYSSEDLNSSKVVVGNNGKKRTYDGSQGPSPEESDNENSSGAGGSEDAPTITQTSFANLREEQKQLHVIAKHPGEIALLPDTWADHFRAVPLPRGVFYKKTRKTSNWPRIYERSEGQDFHGSKVFSDLIKVQSRVRDIRNEYLEAKDDECKDHIDKSHDEEVFGAKYVKALRPALEGAVKWAWKDGDLKRFDGALPPTVTVFQVLRIHNQEDAFEDIQSHMDDLAHSWRERLVPIQEQRRAEEAKKRLNNSNNNKKKKKKDLKQLLPQAPVIFGFAIMEHNVIILHQDASNEEARAFCELNLNMETDNQRQWYTMMIMVTICYARDRLMLLANQMRLESAPVEDSSDPDA